MGLGSRAGRQPPPRVSVVIPCFNDGAYVPSAIESVRAQDFDGWECVVVDDGSNDDSARAIEKAIAGDDRFRLVRHEANRGLPATRNTGMEASSAPLIAFLDADDLLLRRSLTDRVGALDSQDSFDVAGSYSGVRFADADVELTDLPSAYKTGPEGFVDFVTADGECPFPVHGPMTKRSVIEGAGGFDESLTRGTEDWDLWQRILRLGYVFVPATFTTAVYRQRPGAMTREDAGAHVAAATRLLRSAQQPVEMEGLPGGPPPLTRPLGEYRADIQTATRAIRFAAMVMLDGKAEEAQDIVRDIEVSDRSLVARHVDVTRCVEGALRRTATTKGDRGRMETGEAHLRVRRMIESHLGRAQLAVDEIHGRD